MGSVDLGDLGTDAALKVLPSLVEGETATVDGEEVTLSPGSTMPPVLIAGSLTTLRRVARFGDEWYPAFLTPELADEYGRPAPGITINVMVGLGDLAASAVDEQATCAGRSG